MSRLNKIYDAIETQNYKQVPHHDRQRDDDDDDAMLQTHMR
jgi:hypothetical protein